MKEQYTKNNDIVVSILCITYNQAKFIKQTIDGFLMQKTNFNFEILINDDASTDGTAEIINMYETKYPKIFTTILHKENQYSRGDRGMFVKYLFPKAKGKYIALCEGDDYWTDENKLQKQVDFLEKKPDYALCFHPVKVIFENKEEKDHIYPETIKETKFTVKELLEENFIQTNSVIYRKQNYSKMHTNVMPQDWYLHLYHAQFGKIGFINEVMSVYRRHSEGLWWDSYDNPDNLLRKNGLLNFTLYTEILKIYGDSPVYKKIIYSRINDLFNRIIKIDKKYHEKNINKIILNYPEITGNLIIYKSTDLANSNKLLNEQESKINNLLFEIKLKNEEIQSIKSSKLWKTRNALYKIRGKDKAKNA